MDLPGILAPLRILAVPSGPGREMAIAHNRYDRTYTAVARLRVSRASAWRTRPAVISAWPDGAACWQACAPRATRSSGSRRGSGSCPNRVRRCAAGTTTTSTPAPRRPRPQVTAELLATSTLATAQREAYLAFVMDARRAAPSIRAAGGGPPARRWSSSAACTP